MCTIVFWKTLHNCAKRCAFSKGPAEIRHSFFNRAAEKDRQSRLLGQRALQQSSGLLTGPKLSLLGAYWLLSCSRCVWLCAALWTVAHQAPLSIGFSRQGHWNGLAFPPSGDLPDPGLEPMLPAFPALAGEFFITEPPAKPLSVRIIMAPIS